MQYHLFFSEKCKNSDFFLSQLDNNKEKSAMIQRHSIHTPGIKLPRSIVAVPHLIVIDEERNLQHDFVGDDLVRWWVHQTTGKEPDRRAAAAPPPSKRPPVESTGPEIKFGNMDYDPWNSVGYSILDDDPKDPKTKRNLYQTIGEDESMAAPQSRAADNYSKEQKRNEFDERMKQLEESRKMF